MEGYKVQVVQASLQRLFTLPPCKNRGGVTSRRISAAEEKEHHLQFEPWETRPERASEKASRRGARARGRSGAECEERQSSPVPGRRGRVETGSRFTARIAAIAAAEEPAQPPSSPPLPSGRRTRLENPVRAAGLGARRGADVTSPPPPPPGGREWGKRQ